MMKWSEELSVSDHCRSNSAAARHTDLHLCYSFGPQLSQDVFHCLVALVVNFIVCIYSVDIACIHS